MLADGTLHRDFNRDLESHAAADYEKRSHRVIAIPSVRSVARASYPTCAVVVDGRVFCWGDNSSGEVGDGTTIPHHAPVVSDAIARLRRR